MHYPKKLVVQYQNHPVPVYVVGDIQYLYFVAKLQEEGDIYLTLDVESNGGMKWIEIPGKETPRASELGQRILKQMEKEGYKLNMKAA